MSEKPLLSVENLTVRFALNRGGLFGAASYLYAVDDVSFHVNRGETLAIVGESGSGKTTAALAAARLVSSHDGKVVLDGQDVLPLEGEDLRQMRRKVQFIFQDPYSSLNPRQRAEEIVREPLQSLTDTSAPEQQEITDRLFAEVGLRPEQKRLFPHQFSGGQRQRIGIARALATQPELIICDEPVSALDVAVQAQILNLLSALQKEFGLTYLFISHDLGVVQHMCDSVAVMYMGKIVEHADRKSLFNNPLHPYTAALLSAVPTVDKTLRQKTRRILIPGDPPDPTQKQTGCRFASRCPVAQDQCRQAEPPLKEIAPHHRVACHLVDEKAVSPL
ncbi:MAG: ATP-binding cassette domain-containing protein [Alphaproteobacteria bacterium TMED89]|nr:peptide ABC transporter ATP-binding protein [Rhodospirillaceae bacterium]RPH12321.1 MAG: ATP-binding cassette domain-containing protein [Alphaproteobacteria bacterium TMED89]